MAGDINSLNLLVFFFFVEEATVGDLDQTVHLRNLTWIFGDRLKYQATQLSENETSMYFPLVWSGCSIAAVYLLHNFNPCSRQTSTLNTRKIIR